MMLSDVKAGCCVGGCQADGCSMEDGLQMQTQLPASCASSRLPSQLERRRTCA